MAANRYGTPHAKRHDAALNGINREHHARNRGAGSTSTPGGIRETAPKDRTPAPREEMKGIKGAMGGSPDTARGKNVQ